MPTRAYKQRLLRVKPVPEDTLQVWYCDSDGRPDDRPNLNHIRDMNYPRPIIHVYLRGDHLRQFRRHSPRFAVLKAVLDMMDPVRVNVRGDKNYQITYAEYCAIVGNTQEDT